MNQLSDERKPISRIKLTNDIAKLPNHSTKVGSYRGEIVYATVSRTPSESWTYVLDIIGTIRIAIANCHGGSMKEVKSINEILVMIFLVQGQA